MIVALTLEEAPFADAGTVADDDVRGDGRVVGDTAARTEVCGAPDADIAADSNERLDSGVLMMMQLSPISASCQTVASS